MKVLHILLIALVGLLLVQLAVAQAAGAPKAATPTKETTNAVPLKDTPKPKEAAPKEAAKEVPKETVKAAPKETPKETVKEVHKETPKTVKEVPKETPKETVKEAVKEAVKDVKEAVKEAVKEVPKAKETPKEAPKKETPKASKEETKKEGSEYAQKAYESAQVYGAEAGKYGEVAWKEAKKYGAAGAILAQEYSITLSEATADYKLFVEEYTHKRAVEIVDRFLDPQHAQIVKKNYLNWYGVAIIFADIFVIYLIVKHLKWVFSLTALRLFFTAVNLGIYATLATLTILASEDPTKGISASVLAQLHRGLFYSAIVATVLNVLAVVAFPGRVKSFVVALLSVGLFVDTLDFRTPIEGAVGSIPAYTLEALVFFIQAIFVFDSITTVTTKQPRTVKSFTSTSVVAPGLIKEENIKKEKSGKKTAKVVTAK